MSASKTRFRLTRAQKWVLAFCVLVLALALANLGRMVLAVMYAGRLPDLPVTAPWSYWAVMSGVWCVVFVVCLVGLIAFRPWGRWATLAAVTGYELYVWINHLFFDASEYARQLRLRDLLLSGLLLAVVWGFLHLSAIRKVFLKVGN